LGNQKPQQSLPFTGELNNIDDIQAALTGAYDHLQTLSGGDNFAQTVFTQDIIADDIVFTGSFPTFQQINNHIMSAGNGSIEDMWNEAYRNINDDNIILNSLDNLGDENVSRALKDNISAQALFIRALQYYYLVDLF